MCNSSTKLKNFVQTSYNKVKSSKMPKYSHKNSPKKFTQHQHAVVCMLKKKFKTNYRDLIEFLAEMPYICKILGLKKIPHHTTVQKFFQRIDEKEFLLLIEICSANIVAIDGTGFHSYSSKHYDLVSKRRKPYQKLVIGVDTGNQKILSAYTCHGYSHDTNSFIPLVKSLSAKTVVADKGFDSVKNREFAKSLRIKPVIPYRECRELLALMNRHINKVYRRRSLAETAFSVMKRKFGKHIFKKLCEHKERDVPCCSNLQ